MATDDISIERAQRDLEVIRKAIAESRRVVGRWGDLHAVWGVLIMLALGVQWWGTTHQVPEAWLGWVGASVIGVLLAGTVGRRRAERAGIISLPARTLRALWAMCCLSVWCLAFLGIPVGAVDQRLIMPLIAIQLAVAVVTTGVMLRCTVYVVAGVLWLGGGCVALVLPLAGQFPLFMALLICGQVAPALWLWNRERGVPDVA